MRDSMTPAMRSADRQSIQDHEVFRPTLPIILADPSVQGQSHLLVNAGFIRLALSIFPHVYMIAHQTHCAALAEYLPANGKPHNLTFIPYATRLQLLRTIAKLVHTTNVGAVMFTNLDYRLFVLTSVLRIVCSQITFFWVLHSHLASFVFHRGFYSIRNRLKTLLLFDLCWRGAFIVCADCIKQNFLKHAGSRYASRIHSVFHPVGISFAAPSSTSTCNNSISLMFMQGWHSLSGPVQACLNELADICERRRDLILKIYTNTFDTTQAVKIFSVDYRDRISLMRTVDFVLYLPSDSYSLQASGSLMDALASKTPVIGLSTEFSAELAGKIGSFGFFLNSLEKVVEFIGQADVHRLAASKSVFVENLTEGVALTRQIGVRDLVTVLRDYYPSIT